MKIGTEDVKETNKQFKLIFDEQLSSCGKWLGECCQENCNCQLKEWKNRKEYEC